LYLLETASHGQKSRIVEWEKRRGEEEEREGELSFPGVSETFAKDGSSLLPAAT